MNPKIAIDVGSSISWCAAGCAQVHTIENDPRFARSVVKVVEGLGPLNACVILRQLHSSPDAVEGATVDVLLTIRLGVRIVKKNKDVFGNLQKTRAQVTSPLKMERDQADSIFNGNEPLKWPLKWCVHTKNKPHTSLATEP
jgi:hypothetical protein